MTLLVLTLTARILLPIYTWWQLPYYYAGCKMYDILAGKENMETSYWMGKGKALEAFPMLKGDGLVGGVVYYDGESEHFSYFGAMLILRTAQRHSNGYLARHDRRAARSGYGQSRRGHAAAQEV